MCVFCNIYVYKTNNWHCRKFKETRVYNILTKFRGGKPPLPPQYANIISANYEVIDIGLCNNNNNNNNDKVAYRNQYI